MMNKNMTFESQLLSVASFENYKEATFLISVLDEPDAYNRIIPKESGELYHNTIVGYPLVAKLKRSLTGKPIDFCGHEMVVFVDEKGKKKSKFNTIAIGSITDSWIETREVEGYEEEKDCILCKCKLWTGRFPEYFKVFDKLWEEGSLKSSWEMTVFEYEEDNGNKILKVFEFIGNCCLGKLKSPAVFGSGVLEYAEFEEDIETELAEALEKDISGLDINDLEKEEEVLAKRKNDEPVVNVAEETVENPVVEESVAEVVEAKESQVEEIAEQTETTEIASLTQWDLHDRISKACREALGNNKWGYISYWFPEERTVWYVDYDRQSELDFKVFTYEVENDEVKVSEPVDAQLTVKITEVNTVVAEKDNEIGTLKAELEIKDNAIIKAGEKINSLNVQISELMPYKEAADKAEQERIETEIAEHKETLKNHMRKNNLFTEEEIASAEIAELIEARDEVAIKTMIAERYIASFDNVETTPVETPEIAEVVEDETVAVASLETDDIEESPSAFMKSFLRR